MLISLIGGSVGGGGVGGKLFPVGNSRTLGSHPPLKQCYFASNKHIFDPEKSPFTNIFFNWKKVFIVGPKEKEKVKMSKHNNGF